MKEDSSMEIRELHLQHKKHRTILLLPLPFHGHWNPMHQLARILYSRGFSIVVIHPTYNFPDPSKYPDFTFYKIADSLPERDYERCLTDEILSMVHRINIGCIEPLKQCIAKLLSISELDPVSCLISDAIFAFSQEVANGFGIPRLVLRTNSVAMFIATTVLPRLLEKGYQLTQDLDRPVEELPPLTVRDLPSTKMNLSDSMYHQLIADVIFQTNASSGIIWNTEEELEQPGLAKLREELPVAIYPVGPLHKHLQCKAIETNDMYCLNWLDSQTPNSVLYVSFGSVISVSESEFLEIAWGIANSNHPFIWVLREHLVVGSECVELLPTELRETIMGRGFIVSWAPQQQILAHSAIGGFWTHSGWNSTLESIGEGVPMISMPKFGDQMVNAKYISDVWKIGIRLPDELERKTVESAIRKLMEEEDGIKMRENIESLQRRMETSIQPGGHSFIHLENLLNLIISFS